MLQLENLVDDFAGENDMYTINLPEGELNSDVLINCLCNSKRIKKLLVKNIYPKDFMIKVI